MSEQDLASLKAAIAPSLKEGDFDELWSRFTAEIPSTEPDDFLTWLHNESLISTGAFRKLVTAGTLAPGPAASDGAEPTQAPAPPPPPPPPPPKVPSIKPTMAFHPSEINAANAEKEETTDVQARRRNVRRRPSADEGGDPGETAERRQPRRRPGTGEQRAVRRTGEQRDPRRRTGNIPAQGDRQQLRKTGRLDLGRSTEPGKITTGRYDFVGRVGEGAMGQVLLAEDLDLNRKVAFKQMSEETAQQAQLASKFYAEAQITAQLDHPNIVPIYSLERTEEGSLAYSMKLIRGKTLEDYITESVELAKAGKTSDEHSLEKQLEQFLKVLDAMSYSHDRGIVHRDLKPENIMIGAYGEVYVMDWGIARRISGSSPEDPVVLQDEPEEDDETIIGTPQYMSPEQALGKVNELDGASDQYSLGLILFELVSLTQAVTGKTPIKIVMRQQDGEKDPMVHVTGKAIDPALKAIVMKATDRNKARRYEDLRALARDIRRWIVGDETIAYPDNFSRKVGRWATKHRTAVMFSVMAVLLTMAGLTTSTLAYSYYSLQQAAQREERLSRILTTAGRQAGLIDGAFTRYEGILTSVAARAEQRLDQPPVASDEEVYYATIFDLADLPDAPEQGAWPADLQPAEAYGGLKISLDYPAMSKPAGITHERVAYNIDRLAPMRHDFRRALLRSNSEEAVTSTPSRAQRLLASTGVPIAWAYLGLESGLYSGYPGHGGYRAKFDARDEPWYKLAKNTHGPVWGAAHIDASGLGLLLPCSMALYDDEQRFLGVSAIEVTFAYIIDELMLSEDFPTGKYQAFLLNETGGKIIDSSKRDVEYKAIGGRSRELRIPEFEFKQVVDAVKQHRDGHIEITKDGVPYLITFNRMNSLGWYYVVMGRTEDLL